MFSINCIIVDLFSDAMQLNLGNLTLGGTKMKIKLNMKESEIIFYTQCVLYWACSETYHEDEEFKKTQKDFNNLIRTKFIMAKENENEHRS